MWDAEALTDSPLTATRFPRTTRTILSAYPYPQGNDATFEPFKSLHHGDKYIDPSRRALLDQNAAKGKQVVPAAFKAASPMKKSTTPGDFVGTIAGKVPYVPVSARVFGFMMGCKLPAGEKGSTH